MSQLVLVNNFVFVVGQVVDYLGVFILQQVSEVLVKVDVQLQVQGIVCECIVSVNVWFFSLEYFVVFNVVWDVWVFVGYVFMCVCVQVLLMVLGLDVEVVVIVVF